MAVTNSSPTLNYSDNHMIDPAVTLFSWNKSGNLRAGFTLAMNLFRTFHQMGRSDEYICPYLDTLKLLWFKYESQTDWFNANDWFGLIWRWLIPFFWQYELSMIEFCSTLNESKRLCNRTKNGSLAGNHFKCQKGVKVIYLCWWSRSSCIVTHLRHIRIVVLWRCSLIVCTK